MAKHITHPGYDKTSFRIIQHDVYDNAGDVKQTYFTIERWIKGWFRTKWRTLQKTHFHYDGSTTSDWRFNTRDEAAEMIFKLMRGNPRNEIVRYEVL